MANIFILGAGAIGSVYGAKLSKQHDVTLIGGAAHVEAIRRNGLRLRGVEPGTHQIAAATSIDTVPPGALILLTAKVNNTEACVRPLVPKLTDDVVILCVQNGLYSERVVQNIVGKRALVLRAITQFGAVLVEPGVVDFTVAGYTLIEQHERADAIAAVLSDAGLDGRIVPDMKRDMWRKAIFNCVINPITSIVGCDVGGIADPRLDPIKRLVVDECVAVARADGVDFDTDFIKLIEEVFATSRTVASMRQDLQKGRKTEIDHMNGAVAELGARYGIACPVNLSLATIIKYLESRPA